MQRTIIQDSLPTDWFGEPIPQPIHFELRLSPDTLIFSASRKATPTLHPQSNNKPSFMAGLWDYDVAELFLSFPNGNYFEFNLAPNGSFWASRFEAPRVPAPTQPNFEPLHTTHQIVESQSWEASLHIPLALLPSLEQANFNVTGVLIDGTQRFFSHLKLPGKPDFHQPQHFATLPVIKDA